MPILKPEADLFPESLFDLGPDAPWWVAHVRSRNEKLAARQARFLEVPFYLPLREQTIRRNGRRQTSWLPLFAGYLFFRGDLSRRFDMLRTNLCVRVLAVRDQAVLQEDLLQIRRLQEEGLPLVSNPTIGPGDEVLVVDGPFRGYRGTVVKSKGRLRLIVSVRFIARTVGVELDREAIAPAKV